MDKTRADKCGGSPFLSAVVLAMGDEQREMLSGESACDSGNVPCVVSGRLVKLRRASVLIRIGLVQQGSCVGFAPQNLLGSEIFVLVSMSICAL